MGLSLFASYQSKNLLWLEREIIPLQFNSVSNNILTLNPSVCPINFGSNFPTIGPATNLTSRPL